MAAQPRFAPESQLPAGWIPDGAGVSIFTLHDRETGVWEAVIPKFSIAGMGDSWQDAIQNAIELLGDYLSLCARGGYTYEQSIRRLGPAATLRVIADEIVGRFRTRHDGDDGDGAESDYFRIPLSTVPTG